ncbi:nucleotide-binding protein [Clostridia bacterium]|nr:nucleotide-binding protein [Clostridia bacterium]
MQIVIITGLSGAGKGRTKSIFSDFGYFCADNLPPELLEPMAGIGRFERVAIVADIRAHADFDALLAFREKHAARVLFLDADNAYIARRYKETRRRHPLDARCHDLNAAIDAERKLLTPLRELADMTVDATNLSANALREQLLPVFGDSAPEMVVETRSFGFMYGIPPDADMVFDVRFLPNPFYIPELRPLTGRDKTLSDYVMSFAEAGEFAARLKELMGFLIPRYRAEGRQKLVIAIGCTGGRHRSVTLAENLGKALGCEISHRDIEKLEMR